MTPRLTVLHLPMMMFHLMMTMRLMTWLLLDLVTNYYFMTGSFVKPGGYSSTLGLGNTSDQQTGGDEYRKFRVHDLCFFNC